MKIVLTTDYATTDLVSLASAKSTLRVGATYDDANITTMLTAARQLVEAQSNRSILNQVWTIKLDYFPTEIYLPNGRIQSVASVKYIDTAGAEQTLVDGTDYTATTGYDDGRIVAVESWPSDVNTEQNNVVEIIYTAGYGVAASEETSWAETAIALKLSAIYYNMEKSPAFNHVIGLNTHYSLAYIKNGERQSIFI